MSVMAVMDREELVAALARTEAALREATNDLERTTASVLELLRQAPGITVHELAKKFNLSEDALLAFVQTAGELLGGRALSVEDARRAGMLAAAGVAWEKELGPLLSSAQVRALLGDVSRQRVDELLRAHRLIGMRDSAGRRRFPLSQFRDGRPMAALVAAYWIVAGATVSEWTAASWCVATDPALEGRSPLQWARARKDPERLLRVARQDAARLAQ